MGNLLSGLKAGVDDGDSDHPDAMLDAWGQHGNFWEKTLVCRAGHDLVRVSFGAAIRPNDDDRRPKVFDKVPTSASDCEDVGIITDVTQELEGSVMLEEEVHLDTDAADVLEHIGKLHVFWI